MFGDKVLPPLPPPLSVAFSPLHRMRALLVWGFGVSIALHAIFGPVVGTYKTPVSETAEVSMVSLSRKTLIKLPTPAPTPRPTKIPTPPPAKPPPDRVIPPPGHPPSPVAVLPAPAGARLKINAYKMLSAPKGGTSTEETYRVKAGSQEGVPRGTLNSAPAVSSPSGVAPANSSVAPLEQPTSSAAPLEEPTRLRSRPLCSAPNLAARVTRTAEASYPESARDLGATGEVDVLVTLSAAGAVTGTSIYSSSGNRALDEAALRAARDSSFSADIVACQAIAGSYIFHVSFNLEGSK